MRDARTRLVGDYGVDQVTGEDVLDAGIKSVKRRFTDDARRFLWRLGKLIAGDGERRVSFHDPGPSGGGKLCLSIREGRAIAWAIVEADHGGGPAISPSGVRVRWGVAPDDTGRIVPWCILAEELAPLISAAIRGLR